MDLKDATAIVTGGARGIGRGIALSLAREGVNVVIADVPAVRADAEETQRLVQAEGVQALVVETDVTDFAQCQAMAQAALDRFGKIDILVNNAGVIGVAPVVMMDEAEWDRVLDVNLKGTFLCAKAVAPHMIARRAGRIVNMSSMAGKRGAPALSHYCTSKFGVIGFTQSLAFELAGSNVTVNAVCPGMIDSAMWRETLLPALSAARGGSADETFEAFIKERVPLGRPQDAEDIGQAVVYLCRADNVTGESINVSGGAEMA
jgi:NAD(P)-dependent dehydrogenase (short-subunit alcohol dehydrogenase family)